MFGRGVQTCCYGRPAMMVFPVADGGEGMEGGCALMPKGTGASRGPRGLCWTDDYIIIVWQSAYPQPRLTDRVLLLLLLLAHRCWLLTTEAHCAAAQGEGAPAQGSQQGQLSNLNPLAWPPPMTVAAFAPQHDGTCMEFGTAELRALCG